jgi:hypothetical protein
MIFSRRRGPASTFLLVALAAWGIVCPHAKAAGPADSIPYAQRTDAFRRLLYVFNFKPIESFTALQSHPEESLLIVLGDPSCLSEGFAQGKLRSFVERGGAVLIATDKKTDGAAGRQLDHLAGVTVTGETLVCSRAKPEDVYKSEPYCPFIMPVKDSMGLRTSSNALDFLATVVGVGSRPALFRNPRPEGAELRVATNAPSQLMMSGHGWWLPSGIYRLAELSADCWDSASYFKPPPLLPRPLQRPPRIFNISPPSFPSSQPRLFAVGGTIGKGRILVLADHSVFINRMILPSDNDNLGFAANCLHWLRGGVTTPNEALRALKESQDLTSFTGQRSKVLFWDDGRIHADFNVPLAKVPVKPSMAMEPAIVAAVDKTIANLEAKDYFNQTLLENLDDWAGGRRRLIRYVVYLLTFAAFLLVGYRFLWRARYRADYAAPALADAVLPYQIKAGFLEQRRRAQLRSGNVWETAHLIAREFFESAGIPLTESAPPRADIAHGNWRQRRRLNRLFDRWWRLARGNAPVVIPPRSLRRWLLELGELKAAVGSQ